jgi:hypothetical protein
VVLCAVCHVVLCAVCHVVLSVSSPVVPCDVRVRHTERHATHCMSACSVTACGTCVARQSQRQVTHCEACGAVLVCSAADEVVCDSFHQFFSALDCLVCRQLPLVRMVRMHATFYVRGLAMCISTACCGAVGRKEMIK